MPVSPVRPELTDLTFRVFDRAFHPELFPRCNTARVRSGKFSCTMSLGESCHSVLITLDSDSVCEACLEATIELPRRGQLLAFPLHTRSEAALEIGSLFRWETRVQIQQFDRDGYQVAHERWEADARRAYLSLENGQGNRWMPPALSGMSVDLTNEHCLLQVWHTFPENLAMCRIDSIYERI